MRVKDVGWGADIQRVGPCEGRSRIPVMEVSTPDVHKAGKEGRCEGRTMARDIT